MSNPHSDFFKQFPITIIVIVLLISIAVGVSLAIFSKEALFLLLPIIIIIYAIIINRYFELLFIFHLLILIFAQFMSAPILTIRWLSLFALVVVSAALSWKKIIFINQTSLGLGLIGFYSILTSSWSYYPSVSFLRSVALLLMAGLLLLLPDTIHRLHPNVKPEQFIMRIYFWIAVCFVISNAIFFVINPSSSLFDGRFRGWNVNPNDIGSIYAIFFLPILLYEFRQLKNGLIKYGLLFIFILGGIELIASGSRASILAWIVSLLIFSLGQVRWSSRIIIITFLGLTMLGMILYNPQENLLRKFIYRNEVELTGSSRLITWQNVWNKFLNKPIFGSGLGVDETDNAATGLVFESVSYTTEKANSYLGMLQELGIIGALIFVVKLLLPLLKACWTGFKEINPTNKLTNLTIIAIVSAGLINVAFEGWLFSVGSFIGFSFWIFVFFLLDKHHYT